MHGATMQPSRLGDDRREDRKMGTAGGRACIPFLLSALQVPCTCFVPSTSHVIHSTWYRRGGARNGRGRQVPVCATPRRRGAWWEGIGPRPDGHEAALMLRAQAAWRLEPFQGFFFPACHATLMTAAGIVAASHHSKSKSARVKKSKVIPTSFPC